MSFIQAFVLLSLIVSQSSANYWGSGHHKSPCSTSTQCPGVAICIRQTCECPAPLYRAVGGDCQTITYNKLTYVPSVKTTVIYAYPGSACGAQQVCTGGSYCDRGQCCCPSGYTVQATSCVAQGPVAAPLAHAQYAPYSGHGFMHGAINQFESLNSYGGMNAFDGVNSYGAMNSYSSFNAGCNNGCFGGQVCIQNKCCCPTGLVLTAGFCAPKIHVVAPQARPGSYCTPMHECTGGSVCTNGICCCPPGLFQDGEACVLHSAPPPMPVYVQTTYVTIGQPCQATAQCSSGAVCVGTCQCRGNYYESNNGCLLRRHAREAKDTSDE